MLNCIGVSEPTRLAIANISRKPGPLIQTDCNYILNDDGNIIILHNIIFLMKINHKIAYFV